VPGHSQKALDAMLRLRRVRMLQAQARLAQVKIPAETALREVADTEALEREYALKNLGTASSPVVRRQQLFAGKVRDLVSSRLQQATRLTEEVRRRDTVWRQTLTSLRSAEKVVAHIQKQERVEEDRKMRRRSIHRPLASGRWTGLNESE